MVVVALKGLFRQFSRLVQLWRICKRDAVSEVAYSAHDSVLVLAFYTVVCIQMLGVTVYIKTLYFVITCGNW